MSQLDQVSSICQLFAQIILKNYPRHCTLANNAVYNSGCLIAPLRNESGVGVSTTAPCTLFHPNFNSEGQMKWTCMVNEEWEADISNCTFNNQEMEILILAAVLNQTISHYDMEIVQLQVNFKIKIYNAYILCSCIHDDIIVFSRILLHGNHG